MASGSAVRIEPLAGDDVAAAAEVLARAFRDNPLNRAVIGGDPARRLRANRAGMRSLLPVARVHGTALAARCGGVLAGVLVAAPPRGHPLPPPRLAARLRVLCVQGLRVAARWNRVFDALEPLHPPTPHWYLGVLGVAPERQDRGVGRALLRHWLRLVDRDGARAYLETDRDRNVAFYASAGFEPVGDLRVLDTRVWRLERPAARADSRAATD